MVDMTIQAFKHNLREKKQGNKNQIFGCNDSASGGKLVK